jgi:energy-converting hydrogenase Eha subunit H
LLNVEAFDADVRYGSIAVVASSDLVTACSDIEAVFCALSVHGCPLLAALPQRHFSGVLAISNSGSTAVF